MLISNGIAHADSWRDKQWYLDFLRADQVRRVTQGKGVTVAVVDTGVNGNHPDLKGNVVDGRDFVDPGNGWRDVEGHGTAMASLIAGHGHGPSARDGILGIAPQATVLPVRTLPPKADRTSDSHSDDGVEWALKHGSSVINLSIGGGGLTFALRDAFESDAVVVASAGNTAQGSYNVRAPASIPGVVAVSGIDARGNFTSESAKGPEVVLSAPAVQIAGAWSGKHGDYYVGTGTSGAAALVSATAALIRAEYPDISANGVINRLVSTADDKGPPGRDPKYGFGVVNPLKALTADIPDLDYNPLIKGTPGPTKTPTNAAGAKSDGKGGGYLLSALAILGGIAVVTVATGAVLVAVNRRRRSIGALGQSHDQHRSAG
jgi:type VII secretion-associated serine protease mycosin